MRPNVIGFTGNSSPTLAAGLRRCVGTGPRFSGAPARVVGMEGQHCAGDRLSTSGKAARCQFARFRNIVRKSIVRPMAANRPTLPLAPVCMACSPARLQTHERVSWTPPLPEQPDFANRIFVGSVQSCPALCKGSDVQEIALPKVPGMGSRGTASLLRMQEFLRSEKARAGSAGLWIRRVIAGNFRQAGAWHGSCPKRLR